MDLAGRRIALYGRLLRLSRSDAAEAAAATGASVERDLTRRSHFLVVGLGAVSLIPSGHLARKLRSAARRAVPVIGEERFQALLEGQPEPPPTYPIARLQIDPGLVDLLNAFDLVHDADGMCRFADVDTLRTADELASSGHEPSSIISILLRRNKIAPVGRHRLVWDGDNVRLDWNDGLTELDGQSILPLPEHPSLDAIFEEALVAEAEERWNAAARGYELCVQIDRRDPIAPFNLGNVLVQLGRSTEALTRYSQAIARAPDFAEAYYNRSLVHERAGNLSLASRDLERALKIDPAYPDALFNLAQIEVVRNNAKEAIRLLDIFLEAEPDEKWRGLAERARVVARGQIRH